MSQTDKVILQDALPEGQAERAAARLPSMAPVVGPWLFCDGAYAAQMSERRRLIKECQSEVYAQLPEGQRAAGAFLEQVLEDLPEGFHLSKTKVTCPDGHVVEIDRSTPLLALGRMLQQDVCILEKRKDEHVLTGAILCFPASWTLAQKIGRPLMRIHKPVAEYGDVAARVQRLFDGVRAGRPMWRANHMRYTDPTLFQPRPENDPRPVGRPTDHYIRSERQTVLRINSPDAVAFVIHTCVVKAD